MPGTSEPLTVHRSAWIDASPERVWEEFTTFERFAAWFGTGHDLVAYEPRKGGRLEFDSEPFRFGGQILVFDPPRELTFEDGLVPRGPGDGCLFITIRVTALPPGTRVELIVHGFEQLGRAGLERHRGLENGWSALQVNNLKDIVEGRPHEVGH